MEIAIRTGNLAEASERKRLKLPEVAVGTPIDRDF